MLFRIAFLFSLICFFSCQNEKKINDIKLKEVLFKIHQCEAYNELKFNNYNTVFMESCKQEALNDVKWSKADFDASMMYYTKHPEELEALYDTILLKYP